MRQEVELANAEAQQSARRAGKAAGLFSGSAVTGHFALLFLSVALWWPLGSAIALGWSALVVDRHVRRYADRPGSDAVPVRGSG